MTCFLRTNGLRCLGSEIIPSEGMGFRMIKRLVCVNHKFMGSDTHFSNKQFAAPIPGLVVVSLCNYHYRKLERAFCASEVLKSLYIYAHGLNN